MPLSAEDRARRIKVLVFDVDGVLTANSGGAAAAYNLAGDAGQ